MLFRTCIDIVDIGGKLVEAWTQWDICSRWPRAAFGLISPSMIPTCNVWVVDDIHHQVFKFTNDGKLLMTGRAGRTGNDDKHFKRPTDIGCRTAFFISDGYGNARFVKFDKDGKLGGKELRAPGTASSTRRIRSARTRTAMCTSPTARTTASRYSTRTASTSTSGMTSRSRITSPRKQRQLHVAVRRAAGQVREVRLERASALRLGIAWNHTGPVLGGPRVLCGYRRQSLYGGVGGRPQEPSRALSGDQSPRVSPRATDSQRRCTGRRKQNGNMGKQRAGAVGAGSGACPLSRGRKEIPTRPGRGNSPRSIRRRAQTGRPPVAAGGGGGGLGASRQP